MATERPDGEHGESPDWAEVARLRAMRNALLPDELPARPALDLATCFLPANGNVGGDFFAVGAGPREESIFVLGDVVGRDYGAAMRAAYARTLVTSIMRFEHDPARILALANEDLVDDEGAGEPPSFITAVCLVHSPQTETVAWACAGHEHPLRLDDGARLSVTAGTGPPLGVSHDIELPSGYSILAPGEGVLMYTDGISEARRGDEAFGEERLIESLAARAGLEPAAVIDGVRDDVQAFTGGEFVDDACLLALRVRATRAEGDAEEVCSPDLLG